jgi:hypothetical protein
MLLGGRGRTAAKGRSNNPTLRKVGIFDKGGHRSNLVAHMRLGSYCPDADGFSRSLIEPAIR